MGMFDRSDSSSSSSSEEGKPKQRPEGRQKTDKTWKLKRNERLVSEGARDRLVDKTGKYEAVMQADGNFVVYEKGGMLSGADALWGTGTHSTGSQGPFSAQLDAEGHLCVQDGQQRKVWECPTRGAASVCLVGKYLTLKGADGHTMWSSSASAA